MPARIAALLEDRKKLERELSEARKKLAMGGGGKWRRRGLRRAQVGDVKLMARAVEGIEMKDLRSLADEGKKQLGSGVVAIVGVTEDGKAGSWSASPAISPRASTRSTSTCATAFAGSEALGGKGGGGRPDMAQAGGPDGIGQAKAIDEAAPPWSLPCPVTWLISNARVSSKPVRARTPAACRTSPWKMCWNRPAPRLA
jgi:alanyl-tRNA synthetase